MRGPSTAVATWLFLSMGHYLLVFCTGMVKGLTIVVPQASIEGYEGQSLLLQVSCSQCLTDTFLQIKWQMMNISTTIAMYTIRNDGPKNPNPSMSDAYKQRATVYVNGSLLIHKLRLSDEGMYKVTMKNSKASKSASVKVSVLQMRDQKQKELELLMENLPGSHEEFGMEHCSCPGNASTEGFPATPMVYLAMHAFSVVISALIAFCIHLLLKRLAKNKNPKVL